MNTTTRKPKTGSTTFSDRQLFINRELSWLDFNSRVLDEAGMPGNRVLDRLKFISIFSSNLDEFFMVRVAGLRKRARSGSTECDPSGSTPAEQLAAIRRKISGLLKNQHRLLGNILQELDAHGTRITAFDRLPENSRRKMRGFFTGNILPALTPLAADPEKPFPLINSGTLQLALLLEYPKSGKKVTAFVEIPELLGRFIPVPGKNSGELLLAEDLIAANISLLFPGGDVKSRQLFRVTRDMDYHLDPDESEDLLHAMRDKLRQCSSRSPVRVEFSAGICDRELQKFIAKSLKLEAEFCYTMPGFLHLRQFSDLAGFVRGDDLTEAPWQPLTPEIFNRYPTVFEAVDQKKHLLLAHPYHSFDPLLKLLEEAADDPEVLAIKQTLYRVSGNSPVVKALLRAAENGKQVTVVVELKARFDERNNIAWAELLDHSGAHVVYGGAGLKIHCKTLLIVRRENGRLRRYVHFGTGNYNDRTAKLYSDLSLLSCDEKLSGDAAELFNLLSGNAEPPEKWSAIAAAPFDLRSRLIRLINAETELGPKGRIIAKMNSFSDPELIRLIHRAAAAGVEIDLIVRGICCCRPQKGMKNLRIISIIDRYLEHSRIFYFGAEKRLFASSADWMPRNLDRRVEIMFPITDPDIRQAVMKILELQLADRDKGRRLTAAGYYTKPSGIAFSGSRSQQNIYELFKFAARKQ